MAKEHFLLAREATRAFLHEQKIRDHMFHVPTTERYWKESPRVIMLNMESYGYDGLCEVDRGVLMDWLYDSANVGTRTTRYSLAILTVLLDRLENHHKATPDALRMAYANDARLEDTLDRTVYFNINPISNDRVEQNYSAIAEIGSSRMGELVWAELRALDPDIILVSGRAGLTALNGMASFRVPLGFRKMAREDSGVLVRSISHPSRPRYHDWSDAIEGIAKEIHEGTVTH